MLRLLQPGIGSCRRRGQLWILLDSHGPLCRAYGEVIAFEPNPHLAELVRRSLWISGIREIDEVREEAVYSTSGDQVNFFIPDARPMNGRVVEEQPYAGTMIDVPTVRLDDVLPEKVDFIKIDAEGGEREIWRGMSRTIENNPQLQIFLEFNPRRTAHYDPHEFLNTIREDGFALAKVTYSGSYELIDQEKFVANGSEQMLFLRRVPSAA